MAKKKTDTTTAVLAWHWVATDDDGQAMLRDGTIVVPGTTYRLPDGVEPIMCRQGFHASIRALDALQYAPGCVICRVEVSGQVEQGDDKLVASQRTVLWVADAVMALHAFACRVAEDALLAERAAGREPDPRSFEAIAVKRRWMDGAATDEELAAARAAARDAAWDAAWDAARDAARDAAWAAARDAAWAAAWAAARAAAWAAASREKYNGWLEELLLALEPHGQGVA